MEEAEKEAQAAEKKAKANPKDREAAAEAAKAREYADDAARLYDVIKRGYKDPAKRKTASPGETERYEKARKGAEEIPRKIGEAIDAEEKARKPKKQ